MSHRVLYTSIIALSLVALASVAQAADVDPPYIGSQQYRPDPVEFGTGWYIRGDMAATRMPSITTTVPAVPTNNSGIPTAPQPIIARGSDIGYNASLGAGYQFNHWFRSDIVADFHQPISTSFSSGNGQIFCPTGVSYPTNALGALIVSQPTYSSGGCTGNYNGNLNSYDVMVNAYIDIGTWYSVTPYVGAGVGLAFGHYQTASAFVQSNNVAYHVTYTDPAFGTTFTQNFDRTASGTYYNFAWAVMGGVAIDVYNKTKLDIGYRFLNQGKIQGVSNTLYSNEVHAGVRYQID